MAIQCSIFRLGALAVSVFSITLAACGQAEDRPAHDRQTSERKNAIAKNSTERDVFVAQTPSVVTSGITSQSLVMPSSEADEAAIRAQVQRGYRDDMTQIFSPDFKRVWDRALGEDGGMDVDLFCQCQDPGINPTIRVTSIKVNANAADVRVDYKVDYPSAKMAHHRLTFVKTPKGWLLDDFSDGRGESLKGDMASSPAGSWNDH